MERKIRLAPLYPTRLRCRITRSSSERLCQYQRTTKASKAAAQAQLSTGPLSRLPKATCAPGIEGTLRSRPARCSAPLAQLLSGRAGSPAARPPAPLPSGSFSTPITRRLAAVGFSPLPPPLAIPGSFQT